MKLRLIIPLLVFAAIALLLLGSLDRDPDFVPSPLIGKPAPEFALPTVKRPKVVVASSDLAGSPYLLNVWGSWCYACRLEHETITMLSESGVIPVYGLNSNDKRPNAIRWLNQFGDPYAASLYDPQGHVTIDFGAYGAPETFLVDASGVIRYKHIGPLTPEIIRRELMPLISKLSTGQP